MSMMSWITRPLLLTSKRSLTRDMEEDGNVWWVRILVVSSLTPKEPSSTSHWRQSISSSSKGLSPLDISKIRDSKISKISLGNSCEEKKKKKKGRKMWGVWFY
uniref:Uncharacterized protein n=1 Tax=Opuntia streptacantha TaxID=393608 RepID=A0A7C9A978_OPUST